LKLHSSVLKIRNIVHLYCLVPRNLKTPANVACFPIVYKGIAMVHILNGSSVLFWQGMWGNKVRCLQAAELYSFTTRKNITLEQACQMVHLHENFQLPLSETAFQQYLLISSEIDNLSTNGENNVWPYISGNSTFSVSEAYKVITGHTQTHPVFGWLWNSRCQPKHKVFFWLLLHDRLRRRNMHLDSYMCENCILQKIE
jgi:hypothetical protein